MIDTNQRDWSKSSEAELLAGYKEMAAETEREQEAFEWCEALIGDCLDDE